MRIDKSLATNLIALLLAIAGWPFSALAVAAAFLLTLMLCRHFATPSKTVE